MSEKLQVRFFVQTSPKRTRLSVVQAELESAKKTQADLLAKKRQLEQDNDDMQRRER